MLSLLFNRLDVVAAAAAAVAIEATWKPRGREKYFHTLDMVLKV